MAKNKRRVFLVDDHPLIRDGLAQLLNKHPAFHVCGEAGSASDALAWLEASDTDGARPDAAIADISLQRGRNGLELLKEMSVRFPRLPVLILSTFEESLYAERALRAGARGYLSKIEAAKEVIGALNCIIGGDIYVSPALSASMLRQFVRGRGGKTLSPVERLTDRELEVFHSIARGRTSREIAVELHLDPKTIETYRGRIKNKLELTSATQLHQRAFQMLENGEI